MAQYASVAFNGGSGAGAAFLPVGGYASAPASPTTITQTYSTTATTVPAATAGALTDSTTGTPSTTLAALISATVWATDAPVVINALASLAAMCNKLTADDLALRKTQNTLIDIDQAAGLAG